MDCLCVHCYAIYLLMILYSSEDEIIEQYFRFFLSIQPLRSFRILQHFKFTDTILLVIRHSISDYLPLAIILFMFLFLVALFGVQIFNFHENNRSPNSFFDFPDGFITCFTILTTDNWYPFITRFFDRTDRNWIVFYTLTIVFIGNFIILDLFIATMLRKFELICAQQNLESENFKKIETLDQSKETNIRNNDNDENKMERKKKKSMGKKTTDIRKSAPTIILRMSLKLALFFQGKYYIRIKTIFLLFVCVNLILESYLKFKTEENLKNYIFIQSLFINLWLGVDLFLHIYVFGINSIKNSFDIFEIISIIGFLIYDCFQIRNPLTKVEYQFF